MSGLDVNKYMVLVKEKDKTEQIDLFEKDNEHWKIRYFNNSKVYSYKEENIKFFCDPILKDLKNIMVYENNNPLTGINQILDFDTYVRVIFNNGFKKTYSKDEIRFEKNCLSNQNAHNCFEYFKEIANYNPNEEDKTFLSKQYEKLGTVSSSSVLAKYLQRQPFASRENEREIVFPFGFNSSQKSAVEKAMSDQLSVIEGPPGTGKTQTILNIIANAIMNGKTVAVVSNNNSATNNVLEKLEKYNLDFIAAFLGNKLNQETFFTNQTSDYPDMSNWLIDDNDYDELKTQLNESQHKLDEMLHKKNKQALLKQELRALQTEYKYFADYSLKYNSSDLTLKSLYRLNADRILNLLIDYKYKLRNRNFKFIGKIHNFFKYGIYDFGFYKSSPEKVVSYLQDTYYKTRMEEVKKKIKLLTKELERFDFEHEMQDYSEKSMKLLKSYLAQKYALSQNRRVFQKEDLWKNFNSFIKEYPVILSTTHSLLSSAKSNYLFDYVLIDEASQVDLVTGALALSCAKNAVIVGDSKQLPNVISKEEKKLTGEIYKKYNLDHEYNYAEHSLLSSIVSLYNDIPRTLLKEHYRCHPKIINFCNQKFYNNELIILTEEEESDEPLTLFQTVKGNHARGMINHRQIDVIYNEVVESLDLNTGDQSVGITAPYRLQVKGIQDRAISLNSEVDTVHKYQGREKDVIILSTVSNEVNVNDFVDDPNLINVAVSRAVKKLIIVAAKDSEEWRGTNIGGLVNYIKYNNFEIINSNIRSIFDLLYSSYSDKLLEVMAKSKKVSEHTSENLMNIVIENVLDCDEFRKLGRVLHQPLKMLINDTELLTPEERKYAMNELTHTDFVIFNKLDKMPLLVVEVDGYEFHENNPKQLNRDKMKDEILKKYNIPIKRFKTTGSGEEKALRKKLHELLNIKE
ncbi:AAA domain-containing protein [Halobacillus campisalis]|uniref:AAA domain-containing protein n=2 Tax=Halobacillus campisalis TaxID=435909 RepID=A0ABW2K112_9BACI|nr:AAA domain-containing protein [Halobacillus campisalis]